MAPSNKSLASIHQSATLHNFFTRGPASSRSAGASAEVAKRRKRFNNSSVDVPANEIIVIDSDSGDSDEITVVSSQRKKRLRTSGNLTNTESTEHRLMAGPLNGEANKQSIEIGSRNDGSEGGNEAGNTISLVIHETEVPAVQRSASLRSTSLPGQDEGDSKRDTPSISPSLLHGKSLQTLSFASRTSTFRSPSKLVSSHPYNNQANHTETASPALSASSASTSSIGMAVDDRVLSGHLSERWRSDEKAAFEPLPADEDESEETAFDRPPNPVHSSEKKAICPVCEIEFECISQSEMQAHVNKCSDSVFIANPAQASPSTVLRPPIPNFLCPPSSFHTSGNSGSRQLVSCSKEPSASVGNAFSVLMASHRENEAWKEAAAGKRDFDPVNGNPGRRKAPFYKLLQGMPIAVDAFQYGTIPGVTAYFLTHAHSDHYTNLSSNWKSGPIYCSHVTANLIMHILSIDPKWVHPLPMNNFFIIPNTNGVRVMPIEANHCPGSCLFLFEGPQTINAGDSTFKSAFVGSSRIFRYLHCGDFRASPQHVLHPAVKGKRIDYVYLDTTYLDPKYTFAPQPLVVSACAEFARRLMSGHCIDENAHTMDRWMASPQTNARGKQKAKAERILFVVGTYSIGKERIVKAIAHALNTNIYCDARKIALLRCQGDSELDALLTSNPLDANVHLVPLQILTPHKLQAYIERFKGIFTKTIGFRPTGWTYTQPSGTDLTTSLSTIILRSQQHSFTYMNLRSAPNSTASIQIYPVPYSEHSSFFELTCFALSLDWGKMIATVNVGNEASRRKMAKWMDRWEKEKERMKKQGMVAYRQADYW